ncbi:hypothetical protein JCM10449v2_001823 [Rhodotorula kratochvilovae]
MQLQHDQSTAIEARAPEPAAVDDATPSSSSQRIRRTAPQLMVDEVGADDLIAGAPSRNGGRLLTDDSDPWTHDAWGNVAEGNVSQADPVGSVARHRIVMQREGV